MRRTEIEIVIDKLIIHGSDLTAEVIESMLQNSIRAELENGKMNDWVRSQNLVLDQLVLSQSIQGLGADLISAAHQAKRNPLDSQVSNPLRDGGENSPPV